LDVVERLCGHIHAGLSRQGFSMLPIALVDRVETAVSDRLVTLVTLLTIQLALEALTSLEERDKAIAAQWRRRIERARYDADLAERRYEAVNPGNRLTG
jgi:hypothetical protein